MNLCFKSFLERVAPALIDSNVFLDWTSVFIRSDSSEHIIRVDARVRRGYLEFSDKIGYSESLTWATIQPMHEVVTSAAPRKSITRHPHIVVRTVIDTRL